MSTPKIPPMDARLATMALPRAPDQATWDAMSPVEQQRSVDAILDALEPLRELMAEGTRHSRPKVRALVTLSDFFDRARKRVFLASELAVLYPGEEVFAPDLLAVLDTDPDKEVDSWVVAREGRGIDFVLELRNLGRKHKDLVTNVREYARLGVREYFSFDVRKKHLRGFHLPVEGTRVYVPILGQGGRLPSSVLDLDLAVVDGKLRFFQNTAQVPDSGELVDLLERMVSERDQRLDEAEARAAVEADRATAEAERATAEAERAERAEAEIRALREEIEKLRARGPA